MSTQRRKFTDVEKLEILEQAKMSGVTSVLRKHNLSYSVYSKWKEKFQNIHANESEQQRKVDMMNLLEENNRLKKIVAEQALIIEQKNEEIRRMRERQNPK